MILIVFLVWGIVSLAQGTVNVVSRLRAHRRGEMTDTATVPARATEAPTA